MTSRDADISTNISGRESNAGMDMSPMTLEEEALASGWTRTTRPEGGEPAPAWVVGTRGDPDMDSDQRVAGGGMVTDEG